MNGNCLPKPYDLKAKKNKIDILFFIQQNQKLRRSDKMPAIAYYPSENIDWSQLCLNKDDTAVYYLEQFPEKINWSLLSKNPSAIRLLEKNQDKIVWANLGLNPKAIPLLEKNPLDGVEWITISRNPEENHFFRYGHAISWYYLSSNRGAIHLLESYPAKIHWDMLSLNENAIHLLEQNPDKIDWDMLSFNPNAMHLLEKNPEKINWEYLSANPRAIHLLEKNLEKADWWYLSCNPAAIRLLEQNPEKIVWRALSSNENAMHLLFKVNYELTKESNAGFKKELCEYVFHPERMLRLAGDMPLWDYLEYYE